MLLPTFATTNLGKMNMLSILLGMIGWPQVILIIVAVVLLFGGKKIPELMKGIGGGIKEFKNAMDGEPTDQKKKNEDKEA